MSAPNLDGIGEEVFPGYGSVTEDFPALRLDNGKLARIVDRYLKDAALKRETPRNEGQKRPGAKPQRQLSAHSLRHTAGTLALRTGATKIAGSGSPRSRRSENHGLIYPHCRSVDA